jgi:hypothetical protein
MPHKFAHQATISVAFCKNDLEFEERENGPITPALIPVKLDTMSDS